MPRRVLSILGLLLLAGVSRGGTPTEEFRGAWVARFHWASPDGEKCRANIVHLLDAMEENHFNALFFQVRGAAETLYPSSLEPWSPLVGSSGPGFDPLEYAIRESHRRGIQLHAYVNPMPLRSTGEKSPPADRNHLWYSHGPDAVEPWVCVDRDGKPAESEYYYLSPGIPEVHAYLRKVLLDLVRRYDIDGLHLDRIRYPGPEYSHDAASRRRFRERGNPNAREWSDWQREQLDKLINDLAAEIRAEKPRVLLSCAAWGIYDRSHIDGYQGFSSGYHDYCQDSWNWVRLGAMDALVPMIYWDLADPKPNYDELLSDFVGGVGGGHVIGGQCVFSPEENLRQIELTRDAGAQGTALWYLHSAEKKGVLPHLKQTLYRAKAPVPASPRMHAPMTGFILGRVQTPDGQPIVDAAVSLEPLDPDQARGEVFSRTWTSSADGRFAFLNVPPGRVRVVARNTSGKVTGGETLEVEPGNATSCNLLVE